MSDIAANRQILGFASRTSGVIHVGADAIGGIATTTALWDFVP